MASVEKNPQSRVQVSGELFRKGKPPVRELRPVELRRNIQRVLAAATETERNYGALWYSEANRYARELSLEFGVGLAAACAVIAVLSPGTDWNQNKRDAKQMLAEVTEGKAPSWGYTTYGPNVVKARTIAEMELAEDDWSEYVRGPKVTAFWNNMLEPDRAGGVTVDFHAYSVAHGWRFTTANVPKFSRKTYERIATAYRAVAQENGVLPQVLQASVWVTWKRLGR